MIQTLKQIKSRIQSVESIKKVTHAMDLVAIIKLRAAEARLPFLQAYFLKIEALLTNLLASQEGVNHPLLLGRPHKEKRVLCVVTSDNGLCGTYNQNIIRLAEDYIQRYGKEKISLIFIGRKGLNYFKRKDVPSLGQFVGLDGRFSDEISDKILEMLMDVFISREADEVCVAYTHFESFSRQRAVLEKMLDLELPQAAQKTEYLLEPDADTILKELIPLYLYYKMKRMLLDAFVAEHASRIIAMRKANQNAKDLLEDLVLARNKLRQATITKEILEVVTSAEAMR